MLLPLESTPSGGLTPGTPRALLSSSSNELAGEFSPDGPLLLVNFFENLHRTAGAVTR